MLAEIMAGNASRGADRRLPDRAAHEGRDGRRARRPRAHDARARHAGADASATTCVDTAGTGGGRATFNVSTTAALIAAGAGCAVAKHGNRSATGLSGSRRRARGARRAHRPRPRRRSARCIDEAGFGFMFAPAHHQATRYVVPVRKELAVRTIFNFLGPLTNPAGAARQLIGVSDPALPRDDRRARSRGWAPSTCVGRVQRRRPRRDEHVGADARRRGRRRRDRAATIVAPPDVGLDARRPDDARAAARPSVNAEITRRDPRRRARRPRATSRVLNAGAAIYAGGPRRHARARACAAAEAAIDSRRAPRRRSSATSRADAASSAPEREPRDEHRSTASSTPPRRRGRAPPRARSRSPSSSAQLAGAPRGPPVLARRSRARASR